MHNIEMQEMSPEFLKCWQAAGMHLDKQVQGGIKTWLRAHPYPPALKHFSFRLGNQLFFVRVEDVDGKVEGPGGMRANSRRLEPGQPAFFASLALSSADR